MSDTVPAIEGFSPADTKLSLIVVKHMTESPAGIDWESVANEYGYKSGPLAKAKFGRVIKKINPGATTTSDAATTSAASGSRKRKADEEATGGAVKRGRPAKAKPVTGVQTKEEDDDEEEKTKAQTIRFVAINEDSKVKTAIKKEEEDEEEAGNEV
ncbi:hypothetical protein MMC13_006976 [Lambiella insularis]|nr:hypothetical protein [Lambiella insularis]